MTALPDHLFDFLYHGCPAILASNDAAGWPHLVMTWAAARDRRTVRFIADHNTTTAANLARDGRATLQIIGPNNLLFLLKGESRHIRDRVAAASFAMIMMEMTVTEVKDQSWPIVAVSPLHYKWLKGDEAQLAAMEQAVFTELREWEADS